MTQTVKPLVWKEARVSDKWERYAADTIIGSYEALEWSDGTFGGSKPANDSDAVNIEFTAASIEDAKSAAQADYEARIISALADDARDRLIRDLVEALGSINSRTSAGNRTFDELMKDMEWANDESRTALSLATEQGFKP